jgi:hypothetical protein
MEVEGMDLDLDMEQNSTANSAVDLPWDHDLDLDRIGMEVQDQGLFDQYNNSANGSVITNESQV